ncbi:transposable element Tcb1 transposase [Trichonephila clavipes]|nr:transposable element Tcb1 transposase [Trichonephila clavipes]
MTVIYRAVPSRAISQQIQSVTYHSVPTNERRLQQSIMSARRRLLRLPLTGNHTCLRHQWCDEWGTWTMEWNGIVFTEESCFCLQHNDGRIRV